MITPDILQAIGSIVLMVLAGVGFIFIVVAVYDKVL